MNTTMTLLLTPQLLALLLLAGAPRARARHRGHRHRGVLRPHGNRPRHRRD
ncbi:hypothetical protein ACFC1R_04080 [Kitasatospora sp. NPDC056138]|uniref:hypothetical protein n=1 Tax=Kitasatospora sp. NPDC056138 TaxID=3345724 RepID=UPI0035E1C3D2